MMGNEEIIISNNSNTVVARTLRIANLLTFLSFQPYVNPDLTKFERVEVVNMMKLKKGFEDTYEHYVTLHQPNQDYSIQFVNYVNLCKGWFELKETYKLFLDEYCSVEVSVEHGQRFQALINMLDEKKINIYEVAGITNKKAAATAINAYKHLYGSKKKSKSKTYKDTWKWKCVKYSLFAISFTAMAYFILPSFFT